MTIFKAMEILGLTGSFTAEELKKAYYKKARENHSDMGGSDEVMKEINEAHEILKKQVGKKIIINNSNDTFKKYADRLNMYIDGYTMKDNNLNLIYLEVLKLVKEFRKLESLNLNRENIILKYNETVSQIHGMYERYKKQVLSMWKLEDIKIDYCMNINDYYQKLVEYKEYSKKKEYAEYLVKYELESLGEIKNYEYLKDSIKDILNETIGNIINGNNSYEEVTKMKNKIKYLDVIYYDAQRRISRIATTLHTLENDNLKQEVSAWLLSLDHKYHEYYKLLPSVESQVFGNNKCFQVYDSLVNKYKEEDYELLSVLLEEIDEVRDGNLHEDILDCMLDNKYANKKDYIDKTNKYLGEDNIYLAKKTLPFGSVWSIVKEDETYSLYGSTLNGYMSENEEFLDTYLEKLNVYLRSNKFLGKKVKDSNNYVLYSNGYTSICYNGEDNLVYVTGLPLELSEVGSKELEKFKDKRVIREYLNNYYLSLGNKSEKSL